MRRWGARSPPLALPPGSRSDGGARISPPRGVPGGNAALRSASLLEELHFYFPSSLVESPPRIPISTARPGEAWEVWKHLPLPSADTTSSSILISTAPENRLRFLACWFYFVNPLHAEREGARGTPGGAQGSCPPKCSFSTAAKQGWTKNRCERGGRAFCHRKHYIMETSSPWSCRRLSQSGKQEINIPWTSSQTQNPGSSISPG